VSAKEQTWILTTRNVSELKLLIQGHNQWRTKPKTSKIIKTLKNTEGKRRKHDLKTIRRGGKEREKRKREKEGNKKEKVKKLRNLDDTQKPSPPLDHHHV